MDLRALAFDVFGTTVDWRGTVIREARGLGERRGLSADWNEFAEAWRAEYGPALAEVRDGKRPFVKLDVLHREMLERVLPEFGLEALDEEDRAWLTRIWHRLDPWADVPAGLRRLKTKYVIASVSNGDVAMMIALARHADLPWDVILGAEMARTYKPRPEVYLTAAKYLGLLPEQILMVAAHNQDLRGAAACGLRTAFVRRPEEHSAEHRQDLAPEQGTDFDVASFTELADRLGV